MDKDVATRLMVAEPAVIDSGISSSRGSQVSMPLARSHLARHAIRRWYLPFFQKQISKCEKGNETVVVSHCILQTVSRRGSGAELLWRTEFNLSKRDPEDIHSLDAFMKKT